MLVTMFTDASICHMTKVSGWGMCAISDRGKTQASGTMHNPMPDSGCAELAAIANAIFTCLNSGFLLPTDHVLIQTDSIYALNTLEGIPLNYYRRRPLDCEIAERIHDLVKSNTISMSVRHVQGHMEHLGGKHYSNGIADRLARQGMKLGRICS